MKIWIKHTGDDLPKVSRHRALKYEVPTHINFFPINTEKEVHFGGYDQSFSKKLGFFKPCRVYLDLP